MWRTFYFIVVLCVVIGVNSRKYNGDTRDEYLRSKRAKYYSQAPRYYNRPTYNSYNRNPYEYSPPYGYSANDIGAPISKQRPYKVSKRPHSEGLGDEGVQSISQYLSNNDLDKLIELAIERERNSDKYLTVDPLDNDSFNSMYFNNNDYNMVVKNIGNDDDSPKYFNGLSSYFDQKYPNVEYQVPYTNYHAQEQTTVDNAYSQIPIYTDEPIRGERFSLSDAYIQKDINDINLNKNNVYTDGVTMQEERLPKPLNLREQSDYDISFSNNAPALAKPESAYRLENFADLPLMEFENSKLESVNSYRVPHYSVTSSNNRLPPVPSFKPQPPSSAPNPPTSLSPSILKLINAPIVEAAPPPSVAKDQSDAHLKATNIWTHRSKGTAYTLHDDGTLSLEKPTRSKYM